MPYQIPDAGAVDEPLTREISMWWLEAAPQTGIDVTGFRPNASLEERLAWAAAQGLDTGTVYSRFSSKHQHSTQDQVRTNVQYAATHSIYCPPEFVCIDEAIRGYRARRDGLERMQCILKHRYATVLLVFKASRLFRQAFKGYKLIQQEVVEEGLRAISVTQGIDTADTKAWRMLFQVHGMVDDMVVEATADHVRAGLKGLFARGYTVGAIPVGYCRKEIPDAPLTNRGKVRTQPQVDKAVGEKIVEHFQSIRDGMSIRQGCKKWVAEGLPADPRSSKGYMTYPAYRRMLSRIAYLGQWEFGRNRNEFSTKRDYARQIPQPDSEVEIFQCEELRIVDDELFYAVQKKLAKLKTGPRGPRGDKLPQFEDLVVHLFYCASCDERFHQASTKGMHCKNERCPSRSVVNRRDAMEAVCDKLYDLMEQDLDLIEQVICSVQQQDAKGDEELLREAKSLERKISSISSQIGDLYELAGQGSDTDRAEIKGRIRAAQAQRSEVQHELSSKQQTLARSAAAITPAEVRSILAKFKTLLQDAAAGKLGTDAVYKAVAVFETLVEERITVFVEPRPARKQTNVRGVFRPALLKAAGGALQRNDVDSTGQSQEVSVWLREPPLCDRLAPRVHQLMDHGGHTYRSAEKVLRADDYDINSDVVWQIYRRYYEMIGEPVPKRPYNNGNKRKSA